MKNLNSKTHILISSVFLIISMSIIFISFKNINNISKEDKLYKNQNKILKENIKNTEDEINNINSKLISIKDQKDKINKKSDEFSSLNLNISEEDLNKKLLVSFPTILDVDRVNKVSKDGDRYRKLNTAFFNDYEVSSTEETISNVYINSLIANNLLNSKLNKEIEDYNKEIYKIIGIKKYYELTNNFLVKEYITKNYSTVRDESYKNIGIKEKEILNDKKLFINYYDALLYPGENNLSYLNTLNNNLAMEIEKNSFNKFDKVMDKKLFNQMIFSFDVFSENVDYMLGYNIVDRTYETDSGVLVLRTLQDNRGRILVIEDRLDGKAINLNYYDASGEVFAQMDIDNYKVYYLQETFVKDRYEKAKNIYEKFKRD